VRVVCIAGVWDKGCMVWRSFGLCGRFPGLSDTCAWLRGILRILGSLSSSREDGWV
jgi:hypothetical protein